MLKKRLTSLLLSVAMLSSMVLTSCSTPAGDSNSSSSSTTSGTTPTTESSATEDNGDSNVTTTTSSNSISYNIASEPPDMNSITSADAVSGNILLHCMDGLTVLDENDLPKAAIAESWDISDDGMVYTFNLRDDYTWSNGDSVTAHDFYFSMTSVLDPAFAADYSYFAYIFKNGAAYSNWLAYQAAEGNAEAEAFIVQSNNGVVPTEVAKEDLGIVVIDDYTLELTLENPISYLLEMLAFYTFLPVNQEAYETIAQKGTYGTDVDKILTNGAYYIDSWTHESELVVKKNESYPHADSISIDSISFKMMSDSNAALNSWRSNECDVIIITGDQNEQLIGEGIQTYEYSDATCFYIQHNTQHEYLSNVKLRQAITYAIDSESFVDALIKNESAVATQLVPPNINGNNGKFYDEVGVQFESYQLDLAQELFAEAKAELGVESITLELITGDSDSAALHGAYMQQCLQALDGLTVSVIALPFKDRLERQDTGNYAMSMAGWAPDYNDPMTFLDMFETGGGNNDFFYSNPEYDRILNEVRVTADRDTRFDLLMQLEEILCTDFPMSPYYYRSRNYIVSDRVEGVYATAFQNFNFMSASVIS